MILEHAVLEVVPGEEGRFEEAFSRARSVISAAEGFRSLRLGRCVEQANRYLLLVEWDELEDHTKSFRGSAAYAEWKGILHRFYDPFPAVDHYEDLVIVEDRTERIDAPEDRPPWPARRGDAPSGGVDHEPRLTGQSVEIGVGMEDREARSDGVGRRQSYSNLPEPQERLARLGLTGDRPSVWHTPQLRSGSR